MKKLIVSALLITGLALAVPAAAFLYEIPTLTKEDIKKLTDAELVTKYIEVKIELDASRTFHGQAGFTPKEYNRHKDLLNLIVVLRLEMQLREMEVPPIDEWLR